MTDLLPVVFMRGQNESIDPRIAPPDVHAIAQNVRWRKDGRPAKRYGSAQISSTGLDSGLTQFASQAVNAVGSASGTPTLIVGAGVRQRVGSVWSDAFTASTMEIPHWGPGSREPVIRDDSAQLGNCSVASANGYVLYAWDDGTHVFYQVRSVSGSIAVGYTSLAAGTMPRCVAVGALIYIVYKTGTALSAASFDTGSLAIAATAAAGTLNNAGNFFDAYPRSSDWLLVFQSAAAALTAQIMSGAPASTVVQSQAIGMSAAQIALPTITGQPGLSVFVGWVEGASGKVQFATLNAAMTGITSGPTVVETDANNVDQPGMVFESNTQTFMIWSGFVAASKSSYFRWARVDTSGGVTIVGRTYFGMRVASKPFFGPATGTIGVRDSRYFWVHTHNSAASGLSPEWNDQRTYYLMWLADTVSGLPDLRRQMHTPRVIASTATTTIHLADVVSTSNGYVAALMNAIRFGPATAETYGVDSVSFHSIFENQNFASRSLVQAGTACQVSGGALFELDGSVEETGFSNTPVIAAAVGGGGGGIAGGFDYFYAAVYEWFDAQGRRHRSVPSDPFHFASGANSSATLTCKCLIASSRQRSPVVHFYRTTAGGSTFHRVTPNFGAPSALSGLATTAAFVDLLSDAAIAANEFLYTDGGVVPNELPPPCTFLTVCNGRVWLGGQLDRNVITASKLLVDGEPTQFSEEDEFSVFLAEECTGLASLDGTVIAFAREATYLVSGDGPNDQGIGSFNPPQRLPSDVGCIDWRSVVETSMGVFFQAKRGIYLLPRGFNTPLFVGADVESTLSQFPVVVSATLVTTPSSGSGVLGESTVRFVVSSSSGTISSAVLVYDLRTQGWSVDFFSGIGLGAFGRSGTFNDAFVFTGANISTGKFANIWQETPGTYSDNGAFIGTELGTGDIRPFGLGGYGGFDSLLIVGEYRGNSFVNVAVSVDGAAPDFYSFTVQSADAPDGSVYLDVTPKVRMGSSIRVTISDTEGTPSEGFLAQALFIEHETIGKTKRLAAGRRA